MYWISFCSDERPILTMTGFLVSQAKRRGWTTSSVDANTASGEGGWGEYAWLSKTMYTTIYGIWSGNKIKKHTIYS